MGSGGGSTTVQKADPWEGQQPYLKDVFKQAKKFYDSVHFRPYFWRCRQTWWSGGNSNLPKCVGVWYTNFDFVIEQKG